MVPRRKEDKEFYTKGLDIQKSSKLPNGTLGTTYASKGHAFLRNIAPNLPQKFSDDDTSY
jgi:ubiquinone biosynthesis protein Coq4|eukprot:439063-Prymnesium_polylepis.1